MIGLLDGEAHPSATNAIVEPAMGNKKREFIFISILFLLYLPNLNPQHKVIKHLTVIYQTIHLHNFQQSKIAIQVVVLKISVFLDIIDPNALHAVV
jgi:hypothetical protein